MRTHNILSFIPCHRKKERSIKFFGQYFPICARCMGIWIGYLSLPFLFWLNIYTPLYIGILLNVPAFIDGYTQTMGWRLSNNTLRIVTGLSAGIGQMMVVVYLARLLAKYLLKL